MQSETHLAAPSRTRGLRVAAAALMVLLAACADLESEENGSFPDALRRNFHLEIPTLLHTFWGVKGYTGTMPFVGVGAVGCDGDRRDVWVIQHGKVGEDEPAPGRLVTIEPSPPNPLVALEFGQAWDGLIGRGLMEVRLWTCAADCYDLASWEAGASVSVNPLLANPQLVGSLDVGPGALYALDIEVSGSGCTAPYYFQISEY